MNFQLDQQVFQQIINLLQVARIPDNKQQKEVYNQIGQYSQNNDFYLYLATILSYQNQIQPDIRHMAGITLKTLIDRNYEKISQFALDFIKQKLFEIFTDKEIYIRRTVGLIMTTIIYKGGFQNWPNLLDFLINNLKCQDVNIIENTIDCISKIVEDLRVNSENYSFLDSSKGGQQLNVLIPQLLQFCNPQFTQTIRAASLFCLNLCIFTMPPALQENMKQFLDILLFSTQDAEQKIRLRAFQGIQGINEVRSDDLFYKINEVISIVVQGTGDINNEIAKVACCFWQEFLDNHKGNDMQRFKLIQPYLKKLVHFLIKGLKYTQDDLINSQTSSRNYTNKQQVVETEYEDEVINLDLDQEDESNEKKDFFDHGEYTLRRLCGNIIERLAQIFRDDLFQNSQELINQFFYSQDWKEKEAAILFLGGISEGCIESVRANLPNLIPTMLQQINQQNQDISNQYIKSSTLWAVSNYTDWIVNEGNQIQNFLHNYLQILVICMCDKSQKVQESSCHALQCLVEKGSYILIPYISDVLFVIKSALENYTGDSIQSLYAVICTLVEQMEEQQNSKEIAEIMLPPLVAKWNKLTTLDPEIMWLQECFVCIAQVLEGLFLPICEKLIPKINEMMNNYVQCIQQNDQKNQYERKEVFLRAIDLISCIVFVSKNNFQLLINNTKIRENIKICIDDKSIEVRQFIISLLAELSKHCTGFLESEIQYYLPYLAKNLAIFPSQLDPQDSYLALCNNSVVCLAEFCMCYPVIMKNYADDIATQIIKLFAGNDKLEKILARNFAKSLGRIALLDPDKICQKLDLFAKNFCIALRDASNDETKQQAYQGFIQLIYKNPNGILNHMNYFIDSFANFIEASQELKNQFIYLIQEYKKSKTKEEWENYLKSDKYFVKGFRMRIQNQFGL